MIPPQDQLNICFAHVAYQLHERFAALGTGIGSFAAHDAATVAERIGEADVLVVSGLWQNSLLERAPKLRFIQSIGAGTDQFPRDELAKRGIRLASARGVNAAAVAEHAMALILALSRRLPEARDNQAKRIWRGMIGDLSRREDELGGKTLLIVGLGDIGGRLARLAKAFDMRVIGLRRSPSAGGGAADEVQPMSALHSLLPQVDVVVLSCPLTAETEKLIDTAALALMKPSAYLINVSRGRVVDEAALAETLAARRIAGAGIDVTVDEPLAADSSLWAMEHVLITPHTGGETRKYEDNVIEILRENLARLWRGEEELRNQIV
ncbi:MAG: D-2-hydroxyacid dehydrogenase [Alphaproteobacteria bacterium]|nr:D-2-hydroxyacid dehydrogenase [Alphaproteobacteria bacterium]